MSTLLVIDDEPNLCYSLAKTLGSNDLMVLSAGTGRDGIELVRDRSVDAVILDVCLPDISGLEVFDRIRELDVNIPIIVITAQAMTDTAIEAMKRGAFEYLSKPIDLHQMRELVNRSIDLSYKRHVPAEFEQEGAAPSANRIIGRSAAMQEVCKAVGRVAGQDVTVLLEGESGTGKELVAWAIYHHSRRRGQPFLTINCAAIPETLLESELFGHEKGAFTGADRRRIGKFEQANRGTIFLDEIGDMSAPTQAKVLRLLQQQRFERVGGNETIQTDVRVIAATNKNLEELAASGAFRLDLLYRLNAFTIRLPPLRERLMDLPLLLDHFLGLYGGQLGKQVSSVSPDCLELLSKHAWPGNIRELQNVIRYALVHASGETLTPDCLPRGLQHSVAPADTETQQQAELKTAVRHLIQHLLHRGNLDLYRKVTREVDEAILDEILQHTRGNQVQAADLLGISRTTLRAKLRSLGPGSAC